MLKNNTFEKKQLLKTNILSKIKINIIQGPFCAIQSSSTVKKTPHCYAIPKRTTAVTKAHHLIQVNP
jgi:hypothetical protein